MTALNSHRIRLEPPTINIHNLYLPQLSFPSFQIQKPYIHCIALQLSNFAKNSSAQTRINLHLMVTVYSGSLWFLFHSCISLDDACLVYKAVDTKTGP